MTNKITLNDLQVQLLERMAVINEKSGLPPAPSKILALLTVSDLVELTFDQIQETLGISKSATSHALTQLQTFKQIEYTSRIGERKRYFRLKTTNWKAAITQTFENMKETVSIYTDIVNQRPASSEEFNRALRSKIKLLRFIVENLPTMLNELDCSED